MPKLKAGIFHMQFRGDGNPTLFEIVQKIQGLEGERRAAMVIDDPIRPRDNIHAPDEYCLLDFSRVPQISSIDASDLKGND